MEANWTIHFDEEYHIINEEGEASEIISENPLLWEEHLLKQQNIFSRIKLERDPDSTVDFVESIVLQYHYVLNWTGIFPDVVLRGITPQCQVEYSYTTYDEDGNSNEVSDVFEKPVNLMHWGPVIVKLLAFPELFDKIPQHNGTDITLAFFNIESWDRIRYDSGIANLVKALINSKLRKNGRQHWKHFMVMAIQSGGNYRVYTGLCEYYMKSKVHTLKRKTYEDVEFEWNN